MPHADFGEVGMALVIAKPDATVDGKHFASLKATLANFKIPKACLLVDELPRNTMGKTKLLR